MRYILNAEKTEQSLYSGAFHCAPETAAEDFRLVREQWQKQGGNFAYHFEQSFAPGEVTPEECFRCGEELAEALFAREGWQVVFATHLDRDHLHNHFVVNAVHPTTGKKLQTDHEFLRRMRAENDRICKAHQLSVIEQPKGRGKSYAEWVTEKQGGFTWRGMIREDIDALLPECRNLQELLDRLREQGYQIRTGKHLALSPPESSSFFRLYKLGSGYTEEDLARRIVRLPVYRPPIGAPVRTAAKPVRVTVLRMTFRGSFAGMKKRGGFRGQYLYYLIRLRQFLGVPPQNRRRAPAHIRRDAKNVAAFAQDLRLLWDNHIDTLDQLTGFYLSRSRDLTALTGQETALRERLRSCSDPEQMKAITGTLKETERSIASARRDLRAAERIYERSERMRQTIVQAPAAPRPSDTIEQQQTKERKELR